MADRLIRAQVSIPMATGLPKDTVVNTFYFDDDDDTPWDWDASLDACHDMLTTFFQAIDSEVYPNTVGTTASVRYYDMRESEPRVPKDTRTIAITPSSEDPLPHEIAICLSFKATVASGENPRRRRGRVYLGPVRKGACNFQGRVGSLVYTAVANAAAAMENGLLHGGVGSLHTKWAIYSPTTDLTASIDDAFNDVDSGWVDDAFDVQRRRGVAASTRQLWT